MENMKDGEFIKNCELVAKFIRDYDAGHRNRPVIGDVIPGQVYKSFAKCLQDKGEENIESTLNEIIEKIIPGMCHWSHPHNIAWFPCIHPRVTVIGSMLEYSLNCVGFSWASSPALTEMEQLVLDWLADMFGLPDHFKFQSKTTGGGAFQGTAGEAIFNACLASRSRVLGFDSKIDPRKIVAYCSDQAHSTAARAAAMSLMQLRKIKSDEIGRMKGENLIKQMKMDIESGLTPAFVAATLGTTGLCAFDDLNGITEDVRQLEIDTGLKIWIHVDAAYGGPLFWLEEKRHLMKGVDRIDSFNANMAKVGLGGTDSSPMWVRNRFDLINSFIETPDYLKNHENEFEEQDFQINLRNWTIPFGRKFRAIRIWFMMKWFGKEGMIASSRQHLALAKQFESLVEASSIFKVIYPVYWGLVCFQLKAGDNKDHELLARELKQNHETLMTTSVWNGSTYLRATFNQFTASEKDVDEVFQKIENRARVLFEKYRTNDFNALYRG